MWQNIWNLGRLERHLMVLQDPQFSICSPWNLEFEHLANLRIHAKEQVVIAVLCVQQNSTNENFFRTHNGFIKCGDFFIWIVHFYFGKYFIWILIIIVTILSLDHSNAPYIWSTLYYNSFMKVYLDKFLDSFVLLRIKSYYTHRFVFTAWVFQKDGKLEEESKKYWWTSSGSDQCF